MHVALSLIGGVLLSLLSNAVLASEEVTYRDGAFAVSLDQVSLQQLLPWVYHATGVEIKVAPTLLESTLTKQFVAQSLKQGLDLLFEGYGRAYTYKQGQNGLEVASVRIFSKGEAHIPQYQQVQPAQEEDDIARLNLSSQEVIVERDRKGRFSTQGSINTIPVQFLIDTGATSVVLSGDFAAYLGLPFETRQEVVTAGGTVTGYVTRLDQVTVGAIQLTAVEGIVLPQMQGRTVLLGMNVLQQLEIMQQGDRLHLKFRK